jgi:hypothetical protein
MDKPFVKTKDRLINLPNVTRIDLAPEGCKIRFVGGDEVALQGDESVNFVKALRKFTNDEGLGAKS